jgi:hypothetical protein
MARNQFTVQYRIGWGWSVRDPHGNPGVICPVHSQEAAQTYCDARNAGVDHDEAWKRMRQAGGLIRSEYKGD